MKMKKYQINMGQNCRINMVQNVKGKDIGLGKEFSL